MKIALVIEQMDTSRGGRETSTAQIAAELARQNCRVTILCQSGTLNGLDVEVRQLGTAGRSRKSQLCNFADGVRSAIGPGEFDIVHAMLPVVGANVYQPRSGTILGQLAASLRRRQGLSNLASRIGEPLNFRRRLMGRMERQLLRDPRVMCLCVSRMIAAEFEQYYQRTRNVRVVFNAVDAPPPDSPSRLEDRSVLRRQLQVDDSAVVFLSVATNFMLKGVGELIEAFCHWKHAAKADTSKLVIVGGRRFADRYHQQARRLGLGEHVVFVPPADDVFPWYAAADAVALLSWYDPCSRVVLEALRWGIPCMSTSYNGASEMLADGCGIVVESPRHIQDTVAGLARLADPSQRRQMAAAAAKVGPTLDVARHVDELIKVYQEVLSQA